MCDEVQAQRYDEEQVVDIPDDGDVEELGQNTANRRGKPVPRVHGPHGAKRHSQLGSHV